jgi:CubicO group peptidase (beta-lactamase class C family)
MKGRTCFVVILAALTLSGADGRAQNRDIRTPFEPSFYADSLAYALQQRADSLAFILQERADSLRAILQERVEVHRQSVAVAVGLIDGAEQKVYSYGTLSHETARKASGATVFEIGPLTSLFTSVLLANMAERGEVGLRDPVSKYLPAFVRLPARNSQPIRLEHLATHTSGLPPLPDNTVSTDLDNPLAGYTVTRLYEFLGRYALTRDIGTTYAYSDLGMGLLGYALARKAGKPYEALVVERILNPLKLSHTRVKPTLSMETQAAAGHDRLRRPVSAWADTVLAGARSMRSTVMDMMAFISAHMDIIPAIPVAILADSIRLRAAFAAVTQPRHAAGRTGIQTGLGWQMRVNENGEEICWLSGLTGGFYGFAGFNKQQVRGVVILSSAANSLDDIGFYLLDTSASLAPPSQRAASVDPGTFRAYAGTYEFSPGMTVDIVVSEGKLYGQPPGQPKSELLPESPQDFYLKQEDAQITFVKDASGRVTHLLFVKDGETRPAKKIR